MAVLQSVRLPKHQSFQRGGYRKTKCSFRRRGEKSLKVTPKKIFENYRTKKNSKFKVFLVLEVNCLKQLKICLKFISVTVKIMCDVESWEKCLEQAEWKADQDIQSINFYKYILSTGFFIIRTRLHADQLAMKTSKQLEQEEKEGKMSGYIPGKLFLHKIFYIAINPTLNIVIHKEKCQFANSIP